MLARQRVSLAHDEERNGGQNVEGNFERHGGPACDAGVVSQREPRWRANHSLAAAVEQAADAADGDSYRSDEGEPITSDGSVLDKAFGEFDGDVAAEEAA